MCFCPGQYEKKSLEWKYVNGIFVMSAANICIINALLAQPYLAVRDAVPDKAGSFQKKTRNMCIKFVQCWSNVGNTCFVFTGMV